MCSDTVVKIPGLHQTSPCPTLGPSLQTYVPHEWNPLPSHSPSVSPSDSPTRQWGLPFMSRNPRLGCPIGGLNGFLPREQVFLCSLHFPLNYRHHGTQVLTQLLFFHSFLVVCILQCWWYRSPSASFQLIFKENCSTGRWIFDVFMGRSAPYSPYSAILIQGPQWLF